VHYHFLAREEFERRVEAGEFLEWAVYDGHLYGTLRSEVERGLAAGRHVVLDIEIDGARQLRERFANAVHVFVLPPSSTELVQRLTQRNTETAEVLERRLIHALTELLAAPEYDYIVVNDDLVEAVAQVAAILDVESRRVQRLPNLNQVIAGLRQELVNQHERLRLTAAPERE
jgi:guanylate kinase